MVTAASSLLHLPEPGVTVDELAHRANVILSMADLALADGRTASRIDTRTVRFYQTLGLIPKPEYEGRRALYSTTHLLRLIAAKQLQAEGYSLAQIQASLPARPDKQLLKAISNAAAEPVSHFRPSVVTQWSRIAPAERASPTSHSRSSDAASAADPLPHSQSQPPSVSPSPELRAFTLAKGVTLLVDPASTHDPATLAASLADALARRARSSLSDQPSQP